MIVRYKLERYESNTALLSLKHSKNKRCNKQDNMERGNKIKSE